MTEEKIGIIGFGNMGFSIAERLKHRYSVFVFDKDKTKTGNLQEISVAESAADLVNQVKVVILAVKPQDFDLVLSEIKNYIDGRLVISIAAGITTGYIENSLSMAKVIRAMPNMLIKIGKGMTCLCKGRLATDADLSFSGELFKSAGSILIINEDMMDEVTAVSGSGPGYYFDMVESYRLNHKDEPDEFRGYFIEQLTHAAESIGFSHEQAGYLAANTGNNCDLYLVKTNTSPSQAKMQVASKGGTTEAGLEALHKSNGSLVEAVKAALGRAKELAKKEQA